MPIKSFEFRSLVRNFAEREIQKEMRAMLNENRGSREILARLQHLCNLDWESLYLIKLGK